MIILPHPPRGPASDRRRGHQGPRRACERLALTPQPTELDPAQSFSSTCCLLACLPYEVFIAAGLAIKVAGSVTPRCSDAFCMEDGQAHRCGLSHISSKTATPVEYPNFSRQRSEYYIVSARILFALLPTFSCSQHG